MSSLRSLSIKAKLALLLLLFLASVGTVWMLSHQALERLSVNGPIYQEIVSGKDLVADILPPPLYIIEAYLAAHELPEATATDDQDRLAATLTRLASEYDTRHTYWQTNLPEGELKRSLLVHAHQHAETFFETVREDLLPAVRARQFDRARRILDEEVTVAYKQHRQEIDATVRLASQRNAQVEADAAQEISARNRSLVLIVAILCAATALLGWIIAFGIAKPLSAALQTTEQMNAEFRQLNDVLGAIAANDLTRSVPHQAVTPLAMTGTDEVARLARAIDDTNQVKFRMEESLAGMVENLSHVVRKIRASSESLASASTEIAAAAEETAAGSRDQLLQATQVSTAVEEMTANIQESARSTRSVSDVSRSAAENAGTGSDQVAQAIHGMQRIAEVVSASGKTIQKLSESSDAIGQIINVIDDIADQTNLLALNAAIEAARAGEQGRGFAVVADEVRKLAERTSKATGEISGMIKSIQSDTTRAVDSMDKGLGEIRTGQEIIDKAGSSLSQIQDLSQRVMEMIVQISRNAEEQSLAAEEISRSIISITGITKESANGAQQSSQAATELSTQAEELKSMVKRFVV